MPVTWKKMVIFEDMTTVTGKFKKMAYAKAPFALIENWDYSGKIMSMLKGKKLVPIIDEASLYSLLYVKNIDLDMKEENFAAIQNKLKRNLVFYLYKPNDRERRSLFHRVYKGRSSFPNLNLIIKSRRELGEGNVVKLTHLILLDNVNDKSTLFCGTCHQSFARVDNFNRHVENDSACRTEPLVQAKQKCYGKQTNVEKELLNAKLIEPEHVGYSQKLIACYDIETLETIIDGDERERAVLKVCSISMMSSWEEGPNCIVRQGDTEEDGVVLVKSFITYLEKQAIEFTEKTPSKFKESLEWIYGEEKKRRDEQKRCRQEGIAYTLQLFPVSWKQYLRSMITFKIYGFNSAKFDAKVLAPILFNLKLNEVQADENGKKPKANVDVLKRGSSYFSISWLHGSYIQLVDVLNYTSPCSLSNFLKMTDTIEQKSIFPYQAYHTMLEMEAATEFPVYQKFWSDLKNAYSCSAEEYETARIEYNSLRALPDQHPDHITNMVGWLKRYNNLDVAPLLSAIKKWFSSFEEIFNVKTQMGSSLPSLSLSAMMKNYNTSSPYMYSIPQWRDNFRQSLRANIVGGITSNPHRMIDLTDNPDSPSAAKFAPNGDRYEGLVAYDFNSLYPWSMTKELPCSPGIAWDLDNTGQFFKKSTMMAGTSMVEIQYLMYLQFHGQFNIHSKLTNYYITIYLV